METEQFVQAANNALLWQPESDILIERIRPDLSTELATSPTSLFGKEGGSTRQTFVAVESVTADPSFYSVPHEPEVDDGPARLSVPEHLFRFAFWTIARARALDCCIGGHDPLGPRCLTESTL